MAQLRKVYLAANPFALAFACESNVLSAAACRILLSPIVATLQQRKTNR
jgi:hypothetical protein